MSKVETQINQPHTKMTFTVTKDLCVCYQHFERQYYERDLRSEILRTPEKYKLEEDVVPKIPGYLW